jgi:hypothetical protein
VDTDPGGVAPLQFHLGRLEELAKGSDPFGHLLVERPGFRDAVPQALCLKYGLGAIPQNHHIVRFTAVEGADLVVIEGQPRRYWDGSYSRPPSEVTPFRVIARELGRLIVRLHIGFPVPQDVAAELTTGRPGVGPLVWPYAPDGDDAGRWLVGLHWLGWSGQCPGLYAERRTWYGNLVVPFSPEGLDRLRATLAARGVRPDDIDAARGRSFSEVGDVIAASAVALRWLLDRATARPEGRDQGSESAGQKRWITATEAIAQAGRLGHKVTHSDLTKAWQAGAIESRQAPKGEAKAKARRELEIGGFFRWLYAKHPHP